MAQSPATNQFRNWYDEFGYIFNATLHKYCTLEYSAYLAGTVNTTVTLTGGSTTNQPAQPVANCILEHVSEYIKSSMASAQVLLGLTPTMLAVLGPSNEETSVLFVVGQRHVLALCIAAGSPAVFPTRSFEHKDPIWLLREREGRLGVPQTSRLLGAVLVFAEYIFAFAAVANIAYVSRELGVQAICTFAPHHTFLVLFWAFLIVAIHLSGFVTLMLRVQLVGKRDWSLLNWLRRQFLPTSTLGPVKVSLRPETQLYIFVGWFTSILTVCHAIYGTLVFSSMLFISVRDSLTVIARYLASVICCRIILMYELACLRNSYNHFSTKDSQGSELEFQQVLRTRQTGYSSSRDISDAMTI